ncbi:hypothetical protein F4819DRAFT_477289 [Hypoxylon fuscum]|nr:hypothetical protein F4819DRAFT_477289 [Hypoxylon fuscum]
MDPENSRRSACDRCRGQKLRCVRPLRRSPPADEKSLEPCERCVKAGAECINTLPHPRKPARDGRLPPSTALRTLADNEPYPALFPKGVSHQSSIGATSNGDTTPQKRGAKRTESESEYQAQGNLQILPSLDERPWKRRSIDRSRTQFKVPDFNQSVIDRRGSGTSDGNSLSITSGSAPPCNPFNEMASKDVESYNIDDSSYGLPHITELQVDNIGLDTGGVNMMEMIFTPSQTADDLSSATFAANNTPWNSGGVQRVSTPPDDAAANDNDDHLQRLSQLNSCLVKEFSRTNSVNLPDILSFSPCCSSKSSCEPMCPKTPIGRVLEKSQTFLGILESLKAQYFSCAESECSYSEYQDENEILPRTNDDSYPATTAPESGDTTNRFHEDTSTSSDKPAPIDMPIALMILSCYTLLLKTYEAVFSRIQKSLLMQGKLYPQSIPPMLPGVHIGSFRLDNHQDLQMEIILQLSSHLLERIEEALGIRIISRQPEAAPNGTGTHGLLDTTSASAILDIMLKQKDPRNRKESCEGRVVLVKKAIESIREMLRKPGTGHSSRTYP